MAAFAGGWKCKFLLLSICYRLLPFVVTVTVTQVTACPRLLNFAVTMVIRVVMVSTVVIALHEDHLTLHLLTVSFSSNMHEEDSSRTSILSILEIW